MTADAVSKKEAQAAQKRIEKVIEKANEKPDSLINRVVQRIENEYTTTIWTQ